VRVSATPYRETVWSEVVPGNWHTSHCLQMAVEAAEFALELSAAQRQRTVWRLDGGAGSDQHLNWLLQRGYHVMAKGINNRRAISLARQVSRWDLYRREGMWLAEVPAPVRYVRPTRFFVRRWLKDDGFHYSYYVSSLGLPSKTAHLRAYDQRGAAEVEQFRNDKQGLGLQARRKRSLSAQQGYVLLTDLAHNLLADLYHRALANSPFAAFGPQRIVRDLLHTPGRLTFDGNQLVSVALLSQKQIAKDLVYCLQAYCST
jgi:hypothetical protein